MIAQVNYNIAVPCLLKSTRYGFCTGVNPPVVSTYATGLIDQPLSNQLGRSQFTFSRMYLSTSFVAFRLTCYLVVGESTMFLHHSCHLTNATTVSSTKLIATSL